MAMEGMDTDQGTQLVGMLKKNVGELTTALKTLSAQVEALRWEGADAVKFKQDWKSTYSKPLQQAVTTLTEAERRLDKNVKEQKQATASM